MQWYNGKIEFLKTIRSTAGIDCPHDSNDVLLALSGTSLLRTSVSSDTTRAPQSPVAITKNHPRSVSLNSYDLGKRSPAKRQGSNGRSSRRDLDIYELANTSLPSREDISDNMASVAADMRALDVSMDGLSADAPPEVPLFEHFLVIGASTQVCMCPLRGEGRVPRVCLSYHCTHMDSHFPCTAPTGCAVCGGRFEDKA